MIIGEIIVTVAIARLLSGLKELVEPDDDEEEMSKMTESERHAKRKEVDDVHRSMFTRSGCPMF